MFPDDQLNQLSPATQYMALENSVLWLQDFWLLA